MAFCQNPEIIAVILARTQSPGRPADLLPRRTLIRVAGRPALSWVAERLARSRHLGRIAVAVGSLTDDREIVELAEALDLEVYAGEPDNVLARLNLVAQKTGAAHLARINGNFPLLDGPALDELIDDHLALGADYSTNSHYQGVVYGLGAEIIKGRALAEFLASRLALKQAFAGTGVFVKYPERFQVYLKRAGRTAPNLRASLDFEPDVALVEAVLKALPQPDNAQVIDFLSQRPHLSQPLNNGLPAEVGLEKVLLFPEKLACLRQNSTTSLDNTYPVSVEISLTNRCNQACLWCSDKALRQGAPDRMKPRHWKALLADLAAGGTRGVVIEGGGEPTLAPYFPQVVEAAKSLGLAAGLISNGLDLFGEGRGAGLYRHFEWIRISLDASDRHQYQTLKGVDGFDQVLDNLVRLAKEAPQITLGAGYVVSNQNDDPSRLQDLVLALRSLGLSYIQLRPVVDHPGLLSQTRLDFLKKFETEQFTVNLGAMHDNTFTGNQGRPCLAHSLSSVIGADGAVWLCGRLNSRPGWPPLGYLTQNSFKKIWLGPERRRQVALAASAGFCRDHCPPCRMVKYNKLLHDIENLKTKNFI